MIVAPHSLEELIMSFAAYVITFGWSLIGAVSMGIGFIIALKFFESSTRIVDESELTKQGNNHNPPVTPPVSGLGIEVGTQRSEHWFGRARTCLAGGISLSSRSVTTGPLPYPLYITDGRGSRIVDADGNEYIDHLLGYGSAILGHVNSDVTEAVVRQLHRGTMYGTCNTVEVELAEQICRMVPCAELVRFANSGSEAVAGAIRAARGYTGKNMVLKFEGHYHGWIDTLAVSNRPARSEFGPLNAPTSRPHSRGIPDGVVRDVVICTWNTPQALTALLDRYTGNLAAVIAEPIVANNACIMPSPGFLEHLREECSRRGVVLIFDEIVTGFRTAPGGAQELFGVVPDLAVFGKAMGGGFTLSAFAGRRNIMDLIASNQVKHGGTYNGNPLCATAGLYTLRSLANPAVQARIRATGEKIMEGIRRAAQDSHIPCVVQGVGSMFQTLFIDPEKAPKHYRDLLDADFYRYAAFRHALLTQGVHVNSSGLACWFVSAAHNPDDIEFTIAAVERAMRAVG
jgi:glutamate-1-semialdehyde 2,1-aminomutase